MSLNVGNTKYNAFVGNGKIATAFVGNQYVYTAKKKTPAMLFEEGNFYWDDYTLYSMEIKQSYVKTCLWGYKSRGSYVQFNNVNFNGKSVINCWQDNGGDRFEEPQNYGYFVYIYNAKTNELLESGYAGAANVQNYVFPKDDVNLKISCDVSDFANKFFRIKVGEE